MAVTMRRRLLEAFHAVGGFAPFRVLHGSHAVVAMYHRFGAEPGCTAPAVFEAQLRYLARHYHVVPLSELADRLQRGGRQGRRLASVTIDDGYADSYDVALPLLQAQALPATVFVTTAFVDRRAWLWTDKLRFVLARTPSASVDLDVAGVSVRGAPGDPASRIAAADRLNEALKTLDDDRKEERLLRIAEQLSVELPALPPAEFSAVTWGQVTAMEAAGIEIGAHTVSHPILTRVGPDRLRRELHDARLHLTSVLGRPIDAFCYPNGDRNAEVRREVGRAGYRCAVTVRPGLNSRHTHPLDLRRIQTTSSLADFAQSSSGAEALKRAVRDGAPWRLASPA